MSTSKTSMALSMKLLVLAATALLSACGPASEPVPAEAAAPEAEHLTSSDAALCPTGTLCAPTAAVSCTRTVDGDLNCTGSATDGVAPYRYFWRSKYYYYANGVTQTTAWAEGSRYYYEYCPNYRVVDPYQWRLTVELYVVDANGYSSSNIASAAYTCKE